MDDLTPSDPSVAVAADIDHHHHHHHHIGLFMHDKHRIQENTGLQINAAKSEIISHGPTPRAAQSEGFISVAPEEAELLGVPLFAGKKTDDLLENCCSDLNTTISHLSFSAPKMPHTLCCSPCVNRPCLAMFDNLLRKGIGTICNLDLTDIQWLHASLPVKDGWLGERRVSSLASSAFLASAAATDTLQEQLLFRSSIAGTTDTSVSMVRDVWSTAYATDCPTGPAATKQSTLDRVATASERPAVTSSLSDATDKARLLSVTSPHSSDLLHALPLSGCGLRLDNYAIHIAVGLRLGVNICEPHQCHCGASVDARGLHGLSCRGGNGHSARHHSLNNLVWRAMAKADIPALKEPSGLLRTDGKQLTASHCCRGNIESALRGMSQ